MKYRDLRDFIGQLDAAGLMQTVAEPVSTRLEITALSQRVLHAGGPALLFRNPTDTGGVSYNFPVLANLFGTPQRVAMAMGADGLEGLRDVGRVLASLKEPEPPRGLKDAGRLWQMAKALCDMKPARAGSATCQQEIVDGEDLDLARLPIQWCWPDDAGPLITWGLVVTRGPQGVPMPRSRQNLGIYRQQVIARNQVIMRWLAHRGGAIELAGNVDPKLG